VTPSAAYASEAEPPLLHITTLTTAYNSLILSAYILRNMTAVYRAESRLRLCQLQATGKRAEGNRVSQRTSTSEQNHQGRLQQVVSTVFRCKIALKIPQENATERNL